MLTLARNSTARSSRPLSQPRPVQLVLNGAAMDSLSFLASLQRPTNSILPLAWHQQGVHAELPRPLKTSARPQDFSLLQQPAFASRRKTGTPAASAICFSPARRA